MVDVFEQVEEELRSDRYKRLAFTWLPVVGGVLLLALIAALSWWGWTSYQTGRAEKGAVAFDQGLEALQAGNKTGADTAFTEAVDVGNGAYRALALQQRAAIADSDQKFAEAVAFLDEAAEATRDPIIGDIARFKAALIQMDHGTPADVEARLTPLTEEGRPMRVFAQEALALARLQNGKTAEARSLFVLLTLGQDVPDDMRQRAQAGISAIDTGTAAGLAAIIQAQKRVAPPTASPMPAPPASAPTSPAAQPPAAQ